MFDDEILFEENAMVMECPGIKTGIKEPKNRVVYQWKRYGFTGPAGMLLS